MNRRIRIKALHISCLVILFFVISCQREELISESGNLSITLTDGEAALKVRSLPDLSVETAGQFIIKMQNLEKDKVVFDNTLSAFNVSAPHLFMAGQYEVVASYGTNPELALDAPYYTSKTIAFDIESGKTKELTIPCFVGNSLASFKFGNQDKLEKVLKDYYIELVVGDQSVVWHPGDIENPYFKAGSTVELYLKGTWIENNKGYSKNFAVIMPAQKGKNYVYTLNIDTSNMTGVIFDLQIETSVETVTVNETVPQEWLPKPKVEAIGFDDSNTLTYIETADAATAKIAYKAVRPVEDVEFTLNFEDEKLSSLNKTYLLSTLTIDERTSLEAVNIILPTLNMIEGVLDLSAMTANLLAKNEGDVNNLIGVKVKANGRWSEEKTYTIRTLKPEFAVSVYPGNIWTKELTANPLMATDIKTGNIDKIVTDVQYQFSTDGNSWIPLLSDLRKEGLASGTTYYVRALYRDELTSGVTEVRTYEALTIPNASLDDGYDTTNPKSKNPLYTFQGGWIGTRNPLTCHTNGVNAFYVSKSSTLPISDNGSTVAHMMTIGWGAGNSCSFGNKSGSIINNISAGIVCVGEYSASEDSVYGKAAYIRPTSLSFVYKASPYNGDEYQVEAYLENITDGKVVVIGKAFLKSGIAYSSYQTETLSFDYDPTQERLPISHLRIIFKAGTKEDKDHLEDKFTKEGSGSVYSNYYIRGSQFWLDSFELHYDK